MDIYGQGLSIPIIEYEVYNIDTKELLDLNICKYLKIDIDMPVNINENELFKYNPTDEYYNDICYQYTTENNTDIILKDRRNEFINDNLSLCEKQCNYNGYNNFTKKAICECIIKIKFPLMSEIVINKEKLWNNFVNIKIIININIMKCYYTLLKKESFAKNIRNYFISIIIIMTLILCILFKISGFKELENKINIIKKNKEKINNNRGEKNKSKKFENINLSFNLNKSENIQKIEIINKNKKKDSHNHKTNGIITNGEISSNTIKMNPENNSNTINNQQNKDISVNYIDLFKDNKDIKREDLIIIPSKENLDISNIHDVNLLNDNEINHLEYKKASKIDKRTFILYYFSLLKTKHIILFTFILKKDYNSKVIKVILFLFSLSLYATINTLFFDENTIHEIYENKGTYKLVYHIPHIIYSSLISSIINTTLKYLALSEINITKLKYENENLRKKGDQLLDYLTKKFIIFFILIFSFLILFWYYLSCFSAVYKNSQFYE